MTMHVSEVRIQDMNHITAPWARVGLRGGGLSVAGAAARVDELRRRLSAARSAGTPRGRLTHATQAAARFGKALPEPLHLGYRKPRKRKRKKSLSSTASDGEAFFRTGSFRKGIRFIREIA